MSSAHNVCAKNHYLAIVSTIVETDNPQIEIKPGLDLLGPILDKFIFRVEVKTNSRFVSVTDLYVPIDDGTKDHCYISKSYDATSHFETTTDDVKDIYLRIMGKPLIIKEKMRPTQVTLPPLKMLMFVRRKNKTRLLFKRDKGGFFRAWSIQCFRSSISLPDFNISYHRIFKLLA